MEHQESSRDAILVLAFGTTEGGPVRIGEGEFATEAGGRRVVARLDADAFERFARETGAFVASATVDDTDVRRVSRRIQSELRAAQADDETARWRDFGYYLTFPVALLGMLWFRKGWTVRVTAIVFLFLPGCSADLWLTPDQQGRRAYEAGDFEAAASHFVDPLWRGVAAYRAGDFEVAAEAFALVESAEAYYDLGNAQAHGRRITRPQCRELRGRALDAPGVGGGRGEPRARALAHPGRHPMADSPPPGGEPSLLGRRDAVRREG